ncbi:MAG: hypothetical protein HYY86_01740 [Candidatus Harrisonbacteria bacterium]|nr:hypothetical protein [Candidatus Harrisonbacteria bacterium]
MSIDKFYACWEGMHFSNAEYGIWDLPFIYFLHDCLGERRGGILFLAVDGVERRLGADRVKILKKIFQSRDFDKVILRPDEDNNLYCLVADTGDDEADWIWVGEIIDPTDPRQR